MRKPGMSANDRDSQNIRHISAIASSVLDFLILSREKSVEWLEQNAEMPAVASNAVHQAHNAVPAGTCGQTWL